ncbi:delta-60 repeat domain-containing protein [Trichlorobacter thiogenes]|uniref:Delta-60 repeat domain-containing protein n=1 Tax=Trichlorobacter thiogenes TaxID=115783 RepID=A0A1T4N6L5_9BACT|nr:PQQ-binding-like beta-propeller repeat protein [Trichlorobacter thiogenes]SJZ74746.1 delta-60 repeat domain-containing protein [Trichlorobacter thiogenes]
MKRHLVVCLAVTILILTGYATAQCGSWSLLLGGNNSDSAASVQQTADGGFIVAGNTSSFGTTEQDAWVLKLNASGEVVWQKTYGGEGYDSVSAIQQTADGGYIVAGYTNSYGANSNGDAWVLKLDASGEVVWQKTYGGEGYDSASAIQQTADDGYIVAGFTNSFGESYDAWVLKLNASGNVVWQKTYGGTTDSDEAVAIQQTADGGYIVAGTTYCFGAGNSDALIVKLSENGTIEWQKTYGGTGLESASAIQQTADLGYIVAGVTTSFGAGGLDGWLLKLAENGTESWQKTWGGSGGDSFSSVWQTADGGYIVAGSTGSSGAGNGDAWVLKLSEYGSEVWQKTYGGAAGDSVNAVQQTSDNGYIVVGSTASLGLQTFDLWVMKLEQDGSLDGCYSIGETANVPQNSAAGTVAFSSLTLSSSTATAVDSQATIAETSASPSICSLTQPQLTLSVSKSGQGIGTVTSSPSGISCGTKCSNYFNNHASVILSASPSSGSYFSGWGSAEGCTTGTCTVTLSDYNRGVTAAFGLIVNGACGSSQAKTFDTAPTQNLCLTGTPTVVGYNDGKWVWSCNGSPGGSTASCWAHITQVGLSVSKTGNGTVVSNPAGINCGDDCDAFYPYGTLVTLTAIPEAGFRIGGWGFWGPSCPISETSCGRAMTSPAIANVTFLLDPKARIGSTAFGTLQTAYNAVGNTGIIEAKAVTFSENLTLDLGTYFTLNGGYADDYLSRTGYTTLDGNLIISSGGLTVDRLVVK